MYISLINEVILICFVFISSVAIIVESERSLSVSFARPVRSNDQNINDLIVGYEIIGIIRDTDTITGIL